MPRFFIDTSDQNTYARDETGHECVDLDAAKRLAVSALPDIARDELPDGDNRIFLAIVRDAEGGLLLQASLALTVTSLVPNT